MGIEPTLSAWKAEVLPLNYARVFYSPSGGGGRIRTFEGVSRQIYSLIPLATREPLRKGAHSLDLASLCQQPRRGNSALMAALPSEGYIWAAPIGTQLSAGG